MHNMHLCGDIFREQFLTKYFAQVQSAQINFFYITKNDEI